MAGLDTNDRSPENGTNAPQHGAPLPERDGCEEEARTLDVDTPAATPSRAEADIPGEKSSGSELPDDSRSQLPDDSRSECPDTDAGMRSPCTPRRSSIRPVPNWRPQPRSHSSSPMVVVFSGNSERPVSSLSPDDSPSRTRLEAAAAERREPFPLADDYGKAELDQDGGLRTDGDARSEEDRRAEESASPKPVDRLPSPPRAHRGRPQQGQEARSRAPETLIPVDDTDRGRAKPTPKSSRSTRLGFAVGSVLLLGGILISGRAFRGEGSVPEATAVAESASPPPTSTPARPTDRTATPPPVLTAPTSDPTARAEPAESAPTPSPPEAVPASAAKIRHVTLEVAPTDARVVRGGKRHPGPPFEFEIPAGKHVAVEVVRRGFITRRVVLDGSKSTVSVGLTPLRGRSGGSAARSGH